VDPFPLTPDTAAYVPRAATERALAELVAAVQGGAPTVAVVGGAGVGKTLLLHLLAERLGAGIRSVYLPNPRLSPAEVCTWIARRLEMPAGEEVMPFLRAWITHLRDQEQACLLLVDDADAMPEATARWLGDFAVESRGGLRLVLAALAGTAAERVLRAFGEVRRVDPGASLTLDEATEYVAWRLDRAGTPAEQRERFDPATLAELHRVARGNPRRLHLAVEALLRGGAPVVLEDEIAARADAPAPPERAPVAPPAPAGAAKPARTARPRWRPRAAPLVLAALVTALVAALLQRSESSRTGSGPPSAADAGKSPPAAPAAAAPARGAEALAVNVNAVPWARVEVDGVEVGETPLAGIPLLPGPHTFRAELPDGRIVERRVEIDAANRHVVFE
jgi:MSHA biogenesis protein MshM